MFYILALIGMVCWGVSPLFAKFGLRDINPLVGLAVRTFFTSTVILIWLIINGSITELKSISPRTIVLLITEAALATLIGDLAYFAALKLGSASIVMLIMACSPLVTIFCSVIFLNEKISVANLIGACFIIIGIFLIV